VWREWNNEEIARRCGVSEGLVRKVRQGLSPNGTKMGRGKRKVVRKGKEYVLNIANIGKSKSGHETGTEPDEQEGKVTSHPEAGDGPDAVVVVVPPPVGDLADADPVLWLGATNAGLPQAAENVRRGGFEYETTVTWMKTFPGHGDWLKDQTEHFVV